MSKEKFDAKLDQVKGSVKEAAGKVTNDKQLEAEGTVEKLAGKAKEAVKDVKDTISGAIDNISK
ncbi:CsbD family protein [Streptococcus merionis]|uniref:CsbD family protein n=1 Tax=Streptococcus merionis TaxID=400065 RepID=UPI003513B758